MVLLPIDKQHISYSFFHIKNGCTGVFGKKNEEVCK